LLTVVIGTRTREAATRLGASHVMQSSRENIDSVITTVATLFGLAIASGIDDCREPVEHPTARRQ